METGAPRMDPRRRPPIRSALAVAASTLLVLGAACDPADEPAPTDPPPPTEAPPPTEVPPLAADVHLTFDDLRSPTGSSQWSFTNQGNDPVGLDVVTLDGGTLRSGPGRIGSGNRALRTPAFDPTRPAPRAVLRVVGASSGDPLDPGTRSFTFGASFVLDDPSTSTASGSIDDGDNLVQRGLYDDASQYKIELDRRRPLCQVKGRSGEVTVVGAATVQPGRWYRAECRRSGGRITLTLIDLAAAAGGTSGAGVQRWSRDGATGSMRPTTSSVPFTVGGKLRDGVVEWHTDQFNGLIDDVVLDID
jgi:hypothetical protein